MRGVVLDAYLIGLRCTLPFVLTHTTAALPTVLRAVSTRGPRVHRHRAERAVHRSEYAARKLRIPDTCMYRAIVRWTALKRSGLPAELVFGLRRSAPDTGHAWVELDGVAVGEEADDGLFQTYRFR